MNRTDNVENQVIVIKLNTRREETWRYPGQVLKSEAHSRLVEAFFNRSDLPFHGITLRENDRFIERYYDNRWYNIFEIHDRDDNRLKAWYCNVTSPAEFSPGKIAYIDLALDLLVYPDGRWLILDEEEFAELTLDPEMRKEARNALAELISMAKDQSLKRETV
jgi:hypothetical protein